MRKDHNDTRKNISFETMNENVQLKNKEPEILFLDKSDEEPIKKLNQIIDSCLTEVQKQRYLQYISGISSREIAKTEGICQNAVWKSICGAQKKLKKYGKIP